MSTSFLGLSKTVRNTAHIHSTHLLDAGADEGGGTSGAAGVSLLSLEDDRLIFVDGSRDTGAEEGGGPGADES